MNQKTSRAILVVFVVAMFSVAGISLYMNFSVMNAAKQNELSAEEAAARHAASIRGQFETTLNTLLDDVAGQVRDYTKTRKIITDLVRPENLRNPDYIAENYAIAMDMVPQMTNRMNRLFETINAADTRIKALVGDDDIQNADIILERWDHVKEEQLAKYTDYFAFEQELLDRYVRLLKIYNEGRDTYFVDVSNSVLTLEDERLEARARIIRGEIETLQKAQAGLLTD